MAVTISDKIVTMTADNDLTDTLFGTAYKLRVLMIYIVTTVAGVATTIRQKGASGTILYSGTPGSSGTTVVFAPPVPVFLENISAEVLPANHTVYIVIE